MFGFHKGIVSEFWVSDNPGTVHTASGVTRFNISKERFKKIQVPIPPLDVQAEIIRILDAFTALTAELTQELAKEKILREKQYQYYRDCLLTFENSTISEQRTANSEQRTANSEQRGK